MPAERSGERGAASGGPGRGPPRARYPLTARAKALPQMARCGQVLNVFSMSAVTAAAYGAVIAALGAGVGRRARLGEARLGRWRAEVQGRLTIGS